MKRFLSFCCLLVLLLLSSCAKEELSVDTVKEKFKVDELEHYSTNTCAGFTPIRPPVDMLFIWDNTSSQVFIKPETKRALNNTINMFADHFDYHIMLAPFIPSKDSAGNWIQFVFAYDKTTLNLTPAEESSMFIGSNEAESRLDQFKKIPLTGGTVERGYDRAQEILNANIVNAVFRTNSHLVVVLMSNEDDTSDFNKGYRSNSGLNQTLFSEFHEFKLIYDQLNSLQFRFITLIAHKFGTHTCAPEFRDGFSYRKMSQKIYKCSDINAQLNCTSLNMLTDQLNRAGIEDSYSICNENFLNIFDSINNSILYQIDEHRYDHWLIAQKNAPPYDPTSLIVIKKRPGLSDVTLQPEDPNGYTVVPGGIVTKNTRYFPSTGESKTGHMIQLLGTGRINYPECLLIKTAAPAEYYGYIRVSKEPELGTVNLTINQKTILEDSSNGWSYIGFKSAQNVKVDGPQGAHPGNPADTQSGYFFKLQGSAIFSNGADIELSFKPKTM